MSFDNLTIVHPSWIYRISRRQKIKIGRDRDTRQRANATTRFVAFCRLTKHGKSCRVRASRLIAFHFLLSYSRSRLREKEGLHFSLLTGVASPPSIDYVFFFAR